MGFDDGWEMIFDFFFLSCFEPQQKGNVYIQQTRCYSNSIKVRIKRQVPMYRNGTSVSKHRTRIFDGDFLKLLQKFSFMWPIESFSN